MKNRINLFLIGSFIVTVAGYAHLKAGNTSCTLLLEILLVALSWHLLRERFRSETRIREMANSIADHTQLETSLQSQLAFLQTLIDTIPSPIFYKDRNGRYTGCNVAFENYLGLTRKEVVGKTVYDLAPPDLAERYHEMDEALFTNPGVQIYDASVVYADGSRHDVIFNKATFFDKDDLVAGLVGVILDITERKRAEDALIAAEEKFRSLVEQSLVGTYIIQDGKFVYVNPKMAEIFGYTREELTSGMSHLELTAEQDRPLAAENIRKRSAGELQSLQYEFEGVRKDGTKNHIEVYGSSIEYDGRPAIIGTLLDVTARSNAQEALRESEERFHLIFSQNDDAVVLFRMDSFAIIDANPAAENLTGYSLLELRDLTPLAFIAPEDFGRLIDKIPVEDHATPFQLERATSTRKDGRIMSVAIRAKTLRLREEYVFHCSIRDITQKVRLEEEVRNTQAKLIHTNKMTSIGMLASSLAHEINNPNNCISVNAAMLADVWRDAAPLLENVREEHGDFNLRGIPFSQMREFTPRLLSGITEGSRRITAIVHNMRDYVREDKGGMGGEVDVNRLIRNAASILWHHIHLHTDSFQMTLKEPLPMARGNCQQIEQVVINLITNALQALPDKRSGVCVATRLEPQRGKIVIEVRDEGSGMVEDTVAHLAEPFFTTRAAQGGTGLGLYISTSIIKEHQGQMDFASAPGEGTTVTVSLPLAR